MSPRDPAEDLTVVGFAHVVDLDGHAHLEQIAVLPGRSRRGIGTVLLEEACRCAAEQGSAQVTLRTFRDVPWNAPFYARHGFEVLDPEPGWMQPLRDAEARIGLPQNGIRVAMVRQVDVRGFVHESPRNAHRGGDLCTLRRERTPHSGRKASRTAAMSLRSCPVLAAAA